MAEVEATKVEERDEYDEWFDEDEDDSYAYSDEEVDDETEYDEETSAESDEEVDVPDEEDPDTAPETAAEEGAPEADGKQEEDPYAWVSELDPEFQKRVESLVNATKSNAGRAAAEARQRQELQARLDRLQAEREAQRRAAPQGTASSKPVPTSEEVADMDDEELKEFMEEYPHVAASVQKMMERRDAKTKEEILAEVRPLREQAEAQRVYENKQALRKEAERIFNTRETGIDLDTVTSSERWQEWVGSQPKGYQDFIRSANTVQDAAKVLEDFAVFADREVQQYIEQQGQPAAPEPQENTASHADETAARRKAALQGSTPKSRSARVSTDGSGMSYEDWFDKYVES